jgi:hypothetical protein
MCDFKECSRRATMVCAHQGSARHSIKPPYGQSADATGVALGARSVSKSQPRYLK